MLTLLLIPIILATITFIFGKHKVTIKEFLIQLAASAVVAGISMTIMYHQNTHDVEVWNGQITKKARVEVSCSHSYCCYYGQCCSGSGKNRSCHTCCKRTCYRHSYDVDWRVYTDINEVFEIDRLSSQGLEEPPRWTAVKMGEPYSSKHSFENFIKASPDSLFRHDGLVEKYKDKLPQYPQRIYDYHRLDRTVLVNHKVDNLKEWNTQLSEVNKIVGPRAEANVIIVIARDVESDYYQALKQHWISGKKNDIILVMGVNSNNTLDWVEVMAWSQDKMFEVVLADHIRAVGKLDVKPIMTHIQQDTLKYFKRKPMSDYEYLKSAVTPSTTQWVVSMLIGLIVAAGLSFFMYNNDIEDYHRRY